jgi:hypothetical protein
MLIKIGSKWIDSSLINLIEFDRGDIIVSTVTQGEKSCIAIKSGATEDDAKELAQYVNLVLASDDSRGIPGTITR